MKALLLALLRLSSAIGNAQEPQVPPPCPFIPVIPDTHSAVQVSIQTGVYVTADCEVPSQITLDFIPSGMLTTAPGVTVTISGPIRAPLYCGSSESHRRSAVNYRASAAASPTTAAVRVGQAFSLPRVL
jgi:hypothetical protein